MAKTPRQLAGEAARRNRRAPHPDTLDGSATPSGSAQDAPPLPRFDSNHRMSGSARPAGADTDKSAVPQTVTQSTGKVKTHQSGRVYRRVR